MKKILKFMALSCTVFILGGCVTGPITKDKINTDTISVYYDPASKAKPLVFSNINPDDEGVIEEITSLVSKVSEYKAVPEDAIPQDECEMWLQFGEDMVIGIYDGMDCGYVGTSIAPVGEETVYLPEGLNKCVSDIVDVYGYTYNQFSGTVTAVHENSVTITPQEDTKEAKTADSIVISITDYTHIQDSETNADLGVKDILVGSKVEITYDGIIQESYPAGIPGATIIKILPSI